MAAGRAPCHEEAGEFLDALEQSLTPHQPEEELRGRLPPALWRRFEQFSRAPGESAGLGLAERVAVTAYTDRDIGRVVNATARAMSPAGGDLPPEYELGAWLILALDNALTALPPSPGAYWRGMSVRAGWSPMPPELAERWEDAHRPGRLVRHNGYTSLMGEEGRQYGGDWQFLVQSLTARDISAFSLPGDQELLLPRGAILRYEGFRMGYRILTEMREGNVKTNRQFDPDSERTREQIIAGMIAGGYTPTEAEAAMSEIDATLERWNARKASGEHSPISAEATRRMGERMADQVWSPVEKE